MLTSVHVTAYLSPIEQGALATVSNSITETRCTALRIASLQVEKSWFTRITANTMNISLKTGKEDKLKLHTIFMHCIL